MEDERLDRIFKALADATRRRLIDQLRDDPEQSLFQICAVASANGTSISRQAITQHLDMLEKAGLIHVSWSGRTKIHSLDLQPLREAMDTWLRQHLKKGKKL